MTQIELAQDRLTLHLDGIDRLLALKRRIDIPFDRLVRVEPHVGDARRVRGWRALLTRVPGAVSLGTFHQQGGRGLLDAHDPERTLVIGAFDERFSKLVLEVDDPHGAAAAIARAVQSAA